MFNPLAHHPQHPSFIAFASWLPKPKFPNAMSKTYPSKINPKSPQTPGPIAMLDVLPPKCHDPWGITVVPTNMHGTNAFPLLFF